MSMSSSCPFLKSSKFQATLNDSPAAPNSTDSSSGDTIANDNKTGGWGAGGLSSSLASTESLDFTNNKSIFNIKPSGMFDKIEKVRDETKKKGDEKQSATGNAVEDKSTSFVFGQNLTERAENFVVNDDIVKKNSVSSASSTDDKKEGGEEKSVDHNQSDNCFKIQNGETSPNTNKKEDDETEKKDIHQNGLSSSNETENKECTSTKTSLEESAKAHIEEISASKRKYEEVDVKTGEENEISLCRVANVKLYLFDKSKWIEKGRGELHLNQSESTLSTSEKLKKDVFEAHAEESNDGIKKSKRDENEKIEENDQNDEKSEENGEGQANSTTTTSASFRLVMRASGSLKVILNTPLYTGMTLESPSEKTIRLSAINTAAPANNGDEDVRTAFDGDSNQKLAPRIYLLSGNINDISTLFEKLECKIKLLENSSDK